MPGVKAGYWIPALAGNREFDGTINGGLFNHLYAGFALVNRDGFADTEQSVIVFPPGNVGKKFETFPKAVHDQNSKSKALLSIGGKGRSDDIAYVVSDRNRHKRFIDDSIKLAKTFNYDGLDLCWLYPRAPNNINPDQLSALLGRLLARWREALDEDAKETKTKLLLTAAVFDRRVIPDLADPNPIFSYPIQDLSDNLDWINVLAIDFYIPSNSPQHTGPVHAWRNPANMNLRCGSASIDNWINGIGPNTVKIENNKLVLGLPFFGYEWTLADNRQHDFFADANPANEGSSLEFRNIKAHYININAGRRVNDDAYGASYWRHETSWIGYDDAYSIATKVGEASRGKNLRGYIAWHLAADDDQWTLSNAASKAWDDANNNP
ncbi:class V chitinase-like [Juglans microcarpa x Juglans regia]|uniref:class V chitinase-like n=1 Tax=Juglans microcarpa x Juglans regia TaxID=2249226 RepID=UPI001B7F2BF1|nr:class V chitinase-like [Juglans microcarpa x Juglans regia]